MAVLISEIEYRYAYNDTTGKNRISGVEYSSIYFDESLNCTWEPEAYTTTISNDYTTLNVKVRGNIYQIIEYNGNSHKDLVQRINTTYQIKP
ncbi:MAG: hypothetical protein K0R50_2931 [Eubacterium sp.]|jgi:hypothetical protein|nr:hypothetical protein [Eubacterium sp.]